jgi:hypothetical protein
MAEVNPFLDGSSAPVVAGNPAVEMSNDAGGTASHTNPFLTPPVDDTDDTLTPLSTPRRDKAPSTDTKKRMSSAVSSRTASTPSLRYGQSTLFAGLATRCVGVGWW